MSRVGYIRIELHNAAFFITSSVAFVIERGFQFLQKTVREKEKLWIQSGCQPVTHQQSQLFHGPSQCTSLLVPYERGFVWFEPAEVQLWLNTLEANVNEAVNTKAIPESLIFCKTNHSVVFGLKSCLIFCRRWSSWCQWLGFIGHVVFPDRCIPFSISVLFRKCNLLSSTCYFYFSVLIFLQSDPPFLSDFSEWLCAFPQRLQGWAGSDRLVFHHSHL